MHGGDGGEGKKGNLDWRPQEKVAANSMESARAMIAESLAAHTRKKVVASESASKARVYKGLADVSVPFFGEEEQGSDTKNPEQPKAIRDYEWSGLCSDVYC